MQFAPRHVVAMVGAVCAAAVLAPVGVMAATGTLVNITDPGNAGHVARVTSRGTLYTESRAGVPGGAFGGEWEVYGNLASTKLAEAVAPERIAVTEASVSAELGSAPGPVTAQVVAITQTTSTYGCPATIGYYPPEGYTKKILRSMAIRSDGPGMQLVFNGPPLLAPVPAAGKRTCVYAVVVTIAANTRAYYGASGYKFT